MIDVKAIYCERTADWDKLREECTHVPMADFPVGIIPYF